MIQTSKPRALPPYVTATRALPPYVTATLDGEPTETIVRPDVLDRIYYLRREHFPEATFLLDQWSDLTFYLKISIGTLTLDPFITLIEFDRWIDELGQEE